MTVVVVTEFKGEVFGDVLTDALGRGVGLGLGATSLGNNGKLVVMSGLSTSALPCPNMELVMAGMTGAARLLSSSIDLFMFSTVVSSSLVSAGGGCSTSAMDRDEPDLRHVKQLYSITWQVHYTCLVEMMYKTDNILK